MKTLDFYFDYGSPYSYLASTQVESLCQRTGATLRWKPVLLGAVLKATGTGMSEAMASLYKAKYLFKDLQDWAAHYGLPPLVLPAGFPIESIKADRLGLVALEHGKIVEWTRAAYRAAFVEARDISDATTLTELLASVGLDPQQSFARMLQPELKDQLRKNTDEAVEKGVYGVPAFFVGDVMYFGNDRLHFVEKALATLSSRESAG